MATSLNIHCPTSFIIQLTYTSILPALCLQIIVPSSRYLFLPSIYRTACCNHLTRMLKLLYRIIKISKHAVTHTHTKHTQTHIQTHTHHTHITHTHTHTHTWNSLEERSARRTDLYLTTRNIRKEQVSMPPAQAAPTSERP